MASNKTTGQLLMLPCPIADESIETVIPNEVIKQIIGLRAFAVENIKTARRYLRKLDREFPIDDSTFFILNKKSTSADLSKATRMLEDGQNIGVLSEAGCPGIADPGGLLASIAHQIAVSVKPLVGPSSILLTLISSGFNGQQFRFHGYLPKDRKDRIHALKQMEHTVRQTGETQLFMDTPFRNMNVLDDLLNELADTTHLCIASDVTGQRERIRTATVAEWREIAYDLNKIPTIFALGRPQI